MGQVKEILSSSEMNLIHIQRTFSDTRNEMVFVHVKVCQDLIIHDSA